MQSVFKNLGTNCFLPRTLPLDFFAVIFTVHSLGYCAVMLYLVFLALVVSVVHSNANRKLLWGAIRWDAFYNDTTDPDDPSMWVARALQPKQWHDRLPWYSYIDPLSGNVTFNGNAPAVMEREIQYAVDNGIDHWVFDVYPPTSLLSQSLYAYLASDSPLKSRLFFSLLLQASWMTNGGIQTWGAKVEIYAQHFARPEYRVVLNNRPLLYIFQLNEDEWGNNTDWSTWHHALEMLTNASIQSGRGSPYIVLQSFSATAGAEKASKINQCGSAPMIAALSAYALPQFATNNGLPWEKFSLDAITFWDQLEATGFDVVPPVPAGWDQRPRVQNPPPWVPHPSPAFIEMPTPSQMGALVKAAANWSTAHSNANPAGVHLISAWNEFDEGHFISPVLAQFGGASRLEGIGLVLKQLSNDLSNP